MITSKNQLTNLAVLNTVTGEIEQYLTCNEWEDLQGKYTSTSIEGNDKLNDTDRRKNTDLFYMFISEMCGSFYHNYYKNTIPHKFIFRYLYLCTFMNFKNYLEYGNSKEESKLIDKKDLKEILKLKNQQFYETYNYLIEKEMIVLDENNYIKINNSFCNKGEIIKIIMEW